MGCQFARQVFGIVSNPCGELHAGPHIKFAAYKAQPIKRWQRGRITETGTETLHRICDCFRWRALLEQAFQRLLVETIGAVLGERLPDRAIRLETAFALGFAFKAFGKPVLLVHPVRKHPHFAEAIGIPVPDEQWMRIVVQKATIYGRLRPHHACGAVERRPVLCFCCTKDDE